jgi:hypothetical protein
MIQLIQLKSLVFQTAKLQPLSAKSMLDMRTYSLQFIAPTLQIKSSNQFIHYIHTYTNISNLGIIISSKVAQRETKRLLRFGLLS